MPDIIDNREEKLADQTFFHQLRSDTWIASGVR
jgi:hypothetical protein